MQLIQPTQTQMCSETKDVEVKVMVKRQSESQAELLEYGPAQARLKLCREPECGGEIT
jgi:hypothetical protein